jgi:hypothetical protein
VGKLTTEFGAPVVDDNNTMTAGPRGPALLQDAWFLEKLAHFDREVIPERLVHAKGADGYRTFTATAPDIYDGAPWTEIHIGDLKALIEDGSPIEEAAQFLCRSGTVDEVRRKCEELGLKPRYATS